MVQSLLRCDLRSFVMHYVQSFFLFRKLRLAFEHIEQRKKGGYTHEEAVNLTALELTQTADAHCRAFLVQSAYEMIEKLCQTATAPFAKVMRSICELYAYNEAIESIGSLVRVRLFAVWPCRDRTKS